jgi:pantothenate kinase type III
VDILQGNNTYLGGAILPGWATFTGSLSLKTPLPVIQPSQFVHWQPNPGNNTQTSLMAGYSIGYQGAILALLNWAISSLSLEASQLPQLVFTGGLATCVLQLCQQHTDYPVSRQSASLLQECLQKAQIKEHLVFYGLACLHAVIAKDRPEPAEPDFSKKFE